MDNPENDKTLVQIIATNKEVRNKALLSNLRDQKIKFEIVDGIILTESDFINEKFHNRKLSSLICSRVLSPGEIGCAVAHENALKKFLASQAKYSIILEDDAFILKSFDLNKLEEFLSAPSPRLVALGWTVGFGIKSNYVKNVEDFYPVVVPTTGTYGYAVNRSAASVLVNSEKKVIDLPDFPIHTFQKIEFWAIDPPWLTTDFDETNSIIGRRASVVKQGSLWKIRIKLIGSFLILIKKSITRRIEVGVGQILIRMFLRDYFFKQAKKSISEGLATDSGLIFAPKHMERLMIFLRLK